ncbi:hypothetical protein YC2023_005357 [Brassica napus]
MVGKPLSSPPFSDAKELSNGDLAGISSTEIESGFGISMMVAKITPEASVDVTLSEEARVMEMRETEILGMRLGDGAGEGFLWVEQEDGGRGLVSYLAAGRDPFSSLSSVLVLLGVGEKSSMIRRGFSVAGRVRKSGADVVNRCSLSWWLCVLGRLVSGARSRAATDCFSLGGAVCLCFLMCRLRGLPRAVLGCAQLIIKSGSSGKPTLSGSVFRFYCGSSFVASALFQLLCVLRLAACW